MVTRSLVDTNVLVYAFDPRDHWKQRTAQDLLRRGVAGGALVVPHQAILEFVAAVSRSCADLEAPLLPREEAWSEAASLMRHLPVVYPNEDVLRTAFEGAALHRLAWFDAHLWAYAEVFGLPEILSEDFEHGRHYGSVRVVNPFLAAADEVYELPALYDNQDG